LSLCAGVLSYNAISIFPRSVSSISVVVVSVGDAVGASFVDGDDAHPVSPKISNHHINSVVVFFIKGE
jgi:hypothetical protein